MSRQAAHTISPFEFRSDFTAPDLSAADTDDRISISVSELAALLEDTRESTARLLRDEQAEAHAEAMKSSAAALKTALTQIIELAQTLEKSTLSDATREEALSHVRKIASELIDGQGNLFHSSVDD